MIYKPEYHNAKVSGINKNFHILKIIFQTKIENEYGSYYTCDKAYTEELRDIFIGYFGIDVVYFTTGW